MEQNNTNSTQEFIKLPEELQPERDKLQVPTRPQPMAETLESAVVSNQEKEARLAAEAIAREAQTQEVAAEVNASAAAIGLPNTNPYETKSEQ
jgi:hypothetical protein